MPFYFPYCAWRSFKLNLTKPLPYIKIHLASRKWIKPEIRNSEDTEGDQVIAALDEPAQEEPRLVESPEEIDTESEPEATAPAELAQEGLMPLESPGEQESVTDADPVGPADEEPSLEAPAGLTEEPVPETQIPPVAEQQSPEVEPEPQTQAAIPVETLPEEKESLQVTERPESAPAPEPDELPLEQQTAESEGEPDAQPEPDSQVEELQLPEAEPDPSIQEGAEPDAQVVEPSPSDSDVEQSLEQEPEVAVLAEQKQPDQPETETEMEMEMEESTEDEADDSVAVVKPAPLPPLELPPISHEPSSVMAGDEVLLIVGQNDYDSIHFDFGDGRKLGNVHTYAGYGYKDVGITVKKGDRQAEALYSLFVFGNATVTLDRHEVDHDLSGQPVLTGVVEGDGTYDSILVEENGAAIATFVFSDFYGIPVPFTGERTFQISLLERGKKVADCGQVTITGLNSPPERPIYEGDPFVLARVGTELVFEITSADPNNDTVIYEIKYAPEGSEFDQSTGQFTWTPSNNQTGLFLMQFYAYDDPFLERAPFAQRGVIVE